MQQKNYKALFASERENYEIVNYDFKLNDIEEAFVLKHKAAKSA